MGTGQTILAAETTVAKCLSGDPQAVEQARLFRLDQLSMFCGPIIAGIISIFVNIRIFFVVSSLLYIAGIIFLNRSELIKKNGFSPHQANQKPAKKILKGFAIIFKNPILILFSVMAIGNNLISSVIEIISAGVITSKFEGTPQTFAIFNAGAGLAGFLALSLLPILIQRYDRKKIFLFSILLLLISTVFIATGKQVLNFIFSYSVIISSILVIGNYIRTKRGDIIPVEDLGTTVSVITMINQLTVPITGFLFAFFTSNTASYNWIWVVAIIQLAVGCAVLWTERKTEVK